MIEAAMWGDSDSEVSVERKVVAQLLEELRAANGVAELDIWIRRSAIVIDAVFSRHAAMFFEELARAVREDVTDDSFPSPDAIAAFEAFFDGLEPS